MDIEKCFDKMWYSETGNDLFNARGRDDKFVLLAKSNEKCQVAVKTPWGSTTERVILEKIEMQGTVPAPLKASVRLILLSLLLVIVKMTVKMNAIHSKVDTKQLRFGPSKCFKLHFKHMP